LRMLRRTAGAADPAADVASRPEADRGRHDRMSRTPETRGPLQVAGAPRRVRRPALDRRLSRDALVPGAARPEVALPRVPPAALVSRLSRDLRRLSARGGGQPDPVDAGADRCD